VERRILAAMVFPVLLVLTACPDVADDRPPPDAQRAEAAVCLQGEPFVEDGAFPLESPGPGDANRVSDLRWERHPGCERFVVDLVGEDDSPASMPGDVRVEVLRELGVVRVSLRDVEWVDPGATEESFGGPLARAAYSVWSPDGRWVHVDVHLGDAAEAHATVLRDPARVVVDLRPGGGPVPEPAPSDDRVVVLQPRPGPVSYPFQVTGYARTFEANVVARLEQQGEAVFDTFTTATAWVDAWGHYSITVRDGPAGNVVLHVGEHSARDGTWEGVAVEITAQ
jgi:hypothetical protein